MNEITRADVAASQREIRRDAHRERWLILKAVIALAVVAAVVVLREVVLR